MKLFQEFSYIGGSGNGDCTTWAQLLVSMGDPDRHVTASDTRFVISAARAKWLYDHDYRIVGRCPYHPDPSYEKQIQPGELETILANGLKVFPVFQIHGRAASGYSCPIGYQQALPAHSQAEGFGFDRGTTIYSLIGRAVSGGKDIATAVRERYSNDGTALSRFTDHFPGRWGTAENCKQSAWNVLTATDPIFDLARNYFITLEGAMYPDVLINTPGGPDKLDSFVQGFTDAILTRVGPSSKEKK